jgi:hypothetical protein
MTILNKNKGHFQRYLPEKDEFRCRQATVVDIVREPMRKRG